MITAAGRPARSLSAILDGNRWFGRARCRLKPAFSAGVTRS